VPDLRSCRNTDCDFYARALGPKQQRHSRTLLPASRPKRDIQIVLCRRHFLRHNRVIKEGPLRRQQTFGHSGG